MDELFDVLITDRYIPPVQRQRETELDESEHSRGSPSLHRSAGFTDLRPPRSARGSPPLNKNQRWSPRTRPTWSPSPVNIYTDCSLPEKWGSCDFPTSGRSSRSRSPLRSPRPTGTRRMGVVATRKLSSHDVTFSLWEIYWRHLLY